MPDPQTTLKIAERAVRERRAKMSYFELGRPLPRVMLPTDQVDVVLVRADGWMLGCRNDDIAEAAATEHHVHRWIGAVRLERDASGRPKLHPPTDRRFAGQLVTKAELREHAAQAAAKGLSPGSSSSSRTGSA